MAQSREELLAKKREYARKRWAENKERIMAINAASVARAKERLGVEGYAARHRAYCKSYVERNPDARKESCKTYTEKNLEKTRMASLICQKKFRAKHPEVLAERFARWAAKNKGYFAKWSAKQRQENPAFVVSCRLRGRLYAELKKGRYAKEASVFDRDIQLVLAWFEWLRSVGVVDWTAPGIHIDHVLPVSSFDMMNPLDVYAVNHWTNLMPMTQEENSKKHASTDQVYNDRQRELVAKYIGEQFTIKRAA